MVDRRVEVVGRLKSLEESAAPLISFLQNASLVQELRPDKQYNLQMLNDRFQVAIAYLYFGACCASILVLRKKKKVPNQSKERKEIKEREKLLRSLVTLA